MTSEPRNIALAIFERLRASFPRLTMTIDHHPEEGIDLSLDIPEQDGLLFDVALNLQNHDELHLCAAGLWSSWFPCTDPKLAEALFEAASGLLLGHLRILEHWRGTSLAKAELQRPEGDSWKTIYTSGPYSSEPFLSFPWSRKRLNVVQLRVVQNVRSE